MIAAPTTHSPTNDVVFPILYIRVPSLDDSAQVQAARAGTWDTGREIAKSGEHAEQERRRRQAQAEQSRAEAERRRAEEQHLRTLSLAVPDPFSTGVARHSPQCNLAFKAIPMSKIGPLL